MNTEVKYADNDLISIKQIVARTKVRLQLTAITDYDAEIELFINEAAAALGTKPTFRKKNVKLAIVDGKAKLPKGFKKLHGVRMVAPPLPEASIAASNSIWTTQNPVFGDLIYLERTWIEQCVTDNINGAQVSDIDGIVEVSGGYLRFPIPCPFAFCFLSFDGYATNDCDGGILELAPRYERGLSEYSYSMLIQTYPQLYPPEWGNRELAIQRSYSIWVAQRDKIVSDAFADDFQKNKYQVKRILHALLQNQTTNYS